MRTSIRDDIPYFHFDTLPSNGLVRHAVFTRQGGRSQPPYDSLNLSLSVPDDRSTVMTNRTLAYGTHDRNNGDLVHAYLVHGAEVARVTREDNGQYIGPVDALITNEPGCGLTMNYADCAPILLYDPENGAIGLGHAGWQGAVKDLPGAMVRTMQQAYGSDPAQLVAGIGPCIGPCCYEVGEPVISAVRRAYANGNTLLTIPHEQGDAPQPAGHGSNSANDLDGRRPHLDLPEANRRRLAEAGVRHIELSQLCTACRLDLFYSHRAESGRTGRFGVVFLLKG